MKGSALWEENRAERQRSSYEYSSMNLNPIMDLLLKYIDLTLSLSLSLTLVATVLILYVSCELYEQKNCRIRIGIHLSWDIKSINWIFWILEVSIFTSLC